MPSGHFPFDYGYFSWNSVDLSAHCDMIRFEPTKPMLDDNVFGLGNMRNLAGVTDWRLTVRLKQDFDASQTDATLWADWFAGTARTWLIHADTVGGVSVTNPSYSATGLIENYPPYGGGVFGETVILELTIVPGGTAPAIVRATT
jgi:hypothetical protein